MGNDPISNQQKHDSLAQLLGTRKQNQCLSGSTTPPRNPFNDPKNPVYATISDDYLDLVRDGRIQVIYGRLSGCDVEAETDNRCLKVVSENDPTNTIRIQNVDSLISCTGFRTDLGFLDSETILKTIDFQETDIFSPVVLCNDVYHPDLKNMAFVGIYRGPYFGVMDLQAQLAAARMAMQLRGDTERGQEAPEEARTQDEKLLEDARQIRYQLPRPQFPRSDYIGRMDSLVSQIKELPYNYLGDAPLLTKEGSVVLPAMYQPDVELARSVVDDLEANIMSRCQSSSHVTPFLLKSILGKWTFQRTLTQLTDYSSQFVSGTIAFSADRNEETGEDFVLYREDGVMELAGRPIEVFREYHYQFNPSNGALEIFFVESGKRAHLFLSLLFQKQRDGSDKSWVAGAGHLCIKDLYDGRFVVDLDGLSASRVEMKYKVKGPAKDYEALTTLSPI